MFLPGTGLGFTGQDIEVVADASAGGRRLDDVINKPCKRLKQKPPRFTNHEVFASQPSVPRLTRKLVKSKQWLE